MHEDESNQKNFQDPPHVTSPRPRAHTNSAFSSLHPRAQVLIWVGWVVTRILLIVRAASEESVFNDVRYYYGGMGDGISQGLREYPLVGLLPAYLANLVPTAGSEGFVFAFAGLTLTMDAAVLAFVLYHRAVAAGGTGRVVAAAMWIVATALHGTLFLSRLDLFPSLLVGLAAALLMVAPLWAAAILGAATMSKLWPGILAIGLVGSWRSRGTYLRVAVFVGSLVVLAGIVILVGGPTRLTSPFEYQDVRGIQVESVAASLLMMVAGAQGPELYNVEFAASKSFEITGPGDDTILVLADTSFLLLFVFALAWALRRYFSKEKWAPTQSTVVMWIVLIFALLLTNKVFSPQYVLWVIPTLLVALARTDWRATSRYLAGTVAILTLVLVWLTEQIYPTYYGDVINFHEVGFATGVQFLMARNFLLLVVLLVAIAWWAVVAAEDAQVSSESSK